MALNKQRILHELGSVVNQLQSADCGCMGKLFSSPNQQNPSPGNPASMAMGSCGGCRHSCCHNHGMAGNDSFAPMQVPCNPLGRCNPPKLYADTYNYLSQNLMQPIVKEVYDDLRTITPANTMTNNNALASQMGLSAQGKSGSDANPAMAYSGNADRMNPAMTAGANANYYAGNTGIQYQMGNSGNQHQMGYEGNRQQMGYGGNQHQTTYGGNQQPMGNIAGMGPQIAKMIMGNTSSNAGQPTKLDEPMVLNAPHSPHGKIGLTPLDTNQIQYNMQGQQGMMQNTQVAQFMPETAANQVQNNNAGNQKIKPDVNSPQTPNNRQNVYGQHTQGMKKFNEMFPGVMQGLGGDSLQFDPMAIAIQMNPANNVRSLLNNQNNNKLANPAGMSGNEGNRNVPQPANVTNVDNAQANMAHIESQESSLGGQNHLVEPGENAMKQRQQVYSAVGDSKYANEQFDNAASVEKRHWACCRQAQGDQLTNQAIKEPILPADQSRNAVQNNYEYNTLGQPVQLLPADCYKTPMERLPQTLSPQTVPVKSNVKNTESKTSLMGNKPFGGTPSKSQLQQIYHQYKGSKSNTQQNIRSQGGTLSDGGLNAKLEKIPEGTVERVVGDSLANNTHVTKADNVKKQSGDAEKPVGDAALLRKGRNGLQDMVFTSYPTSTAWSFHGDSQKTSSPHSMNRFTRNFNQPRNYR